MKRREELFFAQLYTLYADDLFNYGRRLGVPKDDIDDIIHDLFLNMMLKTPDLSKIENLKSYIFWSFHNKIIDLFRSSKKSNTRLIIFELEDMESSDGKERHTMIRKLEEALNSHIQSLSESQRTALILRYFHNLSYEDIAQILECTPHAARKFVSKAIVSLRKKSKTFNDLMNQ
jgi:RNA polymerase sigma factor (sigma-70 family)